MFSFRLFLALTASYFITFVYAGDTTNTALFSTPTATPTGIRTPTYAGCFSQSVPLIWHGPYIYQALGNCQMICDDLQNLVLGLGNGTDCWCGDYLPPENSKVSDDQCNTPCAGYPQDTCKS
jgi:cell wall integrity and stress response component